MIFFIVTRSKILILERVITIIIILVGIVFLIYPNLTTRIANLVGIGRGSDLIFYLFIIYGIFWFNILSTRNRQIDRKLTKIVRAIALANPYFGNPEKKHHRDEVENN
jgi:small membrane protein